MHLPPLYTLKFQSYPFHYLKKCKQRKKKKRKKENARKLSACKQKRKEERNKKKKKKKEIFNETFNKKHTIKANKPQQTDIIKRRKAEQTRKQHRVERIPLDSFGA